MISVTILTKNSSQYLREVLEALKIFDEVLVYDTGSADNTCEITKDFPNVTLKEGPFIGFGETHNVASSLAKNDWILSVDSDEVMTPDLASEITNLSLEHNTVYSFPRKNFYQGKWIRCCGWHPDRQHRLYNRQITRFSDAKVHESIITKGLILKSLKNAVIHYPYKNTTDFLAKMQSYSELFAEQNQGKRKSSTITAIGHALFTFFKSYFLKRGLLGGRQGFHISIYNANTAFYKYIKLAERNKELL